MGLLKITDVKMYGIVWNFIKLWGYGKPVTP